MAEEVVAAEPSTGTSIFDPVLCELAYLWFSPPDGRVLDPFAGGSVRGIVAGWLGRSYIGIELRPEQVAANVAQLGTIKPKVAPAWIQGDSTNAAALAPGEYDLVFTCPPYGDLERYSDDPADISTMSYADFIAALRKIMAASIGMLKQDRFACVVVGDFRDRRGFYRNFVSDTIAAVQAAGAQLYNEAILVTAVGSLSIRAGRQFAAGRKLGKALRNGTLVLAPTGWTPIDSLTVGATVVAHDGSPTQVTGVFPQGQRSMWTIRFHDGTEIDADSEHRWAVDVRGQDRSVMTTAEIIERHGLEPRDPRPRIPTCGAVQMPSRPTPVDPYLVGLLLGDGGLTGNTPILSTADAEIADALPKLLPPDMIIKRRRYDHRLVGAGARSLKNPLTGELRKLGMMGKPAHAKCVPHQYLWNTESVRLAVLRGLMDTDGCITAGTHGSCEFSTTSRALADDVTFLVRSLGGNAKVIPRAPTSYTHRGEKRRGRPSFRVRIFGGPCPFQLSRKANLWEPKKGRWQRTTQRKIESIRRAPDGLATCISIAHPSGLFVAENFVVTHNTHQNVLVFCKGDPAKAAKACGTVEVTSDWTPADEFVNSEA